DGTAWISFYCAGRARSQADGATAAPTPIGGGPQAIPQYRLGGSGRGSADRGSRGMVGARPRRSAAATAGSAHDIDRQGSIPYVLARRHACSVRVEWREGGQF